MGSMDGMDDEITRRGAFGLRAEVTRLRRELDDMTARAERAEKDAKTLSEFLVSRGSLRVWQHADVLRLLDVIARGTIMRLIAQTTAAASKSVPASHVFYRRLGDQMRDEVQRDVAELLRDGLARGDMVSDTMREDVRAALQVGAE